MSKRVSNKKHVRKTPPRSVRSGKRNMGDNRLVGTCKKLKKNRFAGLDPALLFKEKKLVDGKWVRRS